VIGAMGGAHPGVVLIAGLAGEHAQIGQVDGRNMGISSGPRQRDSPIKDGRKQRVFGRCDRDGQPAAGAAR
jgi:hypothetical protein